MTIIDLSFDKFPKIWAFIQKWKHCAAYGMDFGLVLFTLARGIT